MAATVGQTVFDAALDELATGNNLVLCSEEPTTYTEANATHVLARATLTSGDFTIAAGDGPAGARKVTLAAQTCVGENTGLATWFAIIRTADSTLLHRNTMQNVGITNGENQEVNAVRVLELLQPT